MYAVIESGGKQYRVELGSEIEVDRLDVEPGQHIDIARVLLVADGERAAIGRPVVEGATVSASVVRQVRGDKIVVFKYKPKARTRVKNGHRAELTLLRIADIAWDGRSAAKEQARVDAEEQKSATAAQQEATKRAVADQALAAQLAAAKTAVQASATEAPKPARRARAKATSAEATSAEAADTEATSVEAADTGTTAAAEAEATTATTTSSDAEVSPAEQTTKDE